MQSYAEKLRVASRRCKVAEIVLRGTRNQFEICRLLGMEPRQQPIISKDLKALNAEFRERSAGDIDEHKGRELARLELIEAAAWKGWEKSLLDSETREASMRGDMESAKKISKGQAGDPAFLRIVLDCVSQRRSILGLDAPHKVAPTNIKGDQPYAPFTDDERAAALERIYAGVRARSRNSNTAQSGDANGSLLGGPGANPDGHGDDTGPVAGGVAEGILDAGIAPLLPPNREEPGIGGAGVG